MSSPNEAMIMVSPLVWMLPHGSAAVAETKENTHQFKKTRICRFFPKCFKGDSCSFAHTNQELRSCPDLLKTRICAGWRAGRCALLDSNHCKFAHGPEELRGSPESADGRASSSVSSNENFQLNDLGGRPNQLAINTQYNYNEAAPSSKQPDSSPTRSSPQGLQAIVASWVEGIKTLSSDGPGSEGITTPPTPEECRKALLMCMPEQYED
mmetsp:Transcript_47938/g.128461  ORF Transcript_47938/g.128461 Transcript_47938/m.128461 type:complete len:210 (+) Transcript_47938:118-747(+)